MEPKLAQIFKLCVSIYTQYAYVFMHMKNIYVSWCQNALEIGTHDHVL